MWYVYLYAIAFIIGCVSFLLRDFFTNGPWRR